MEEWEIAKEETKTILKIRFMAIVEVLEGQQRVEFWLCIKHKDEFVSMLVLTLKHHLYRVFQSFCWMLPVTALLANLCFVCM